MLHGMPVEMSSPVKQLEQWWHYLLIWSKDSGINQNKYSPKISIRNQKSILSFLRKTLGSVTLWVLCSGYEAQDLEVASNGHPAAWRAASRILFSSIENMDFSDVSCSTNIRPCYMNCRRSRQQWQWRFWILGDTTPHGPRPGQGAQQRNLEMFQGR